MRKNSDSTSVFALHQLRPGWARCAAVTAAVFITAAILPTAFLQLAKHRICAPDAALHSQTPGPGSQARSTAAGWLSRRRPGSRFTEGDPAAIKDQNYFALCLATKEQHEDLREWVGHHLHIGASTIYLYDHLSEPPLRETVADYVADGRVIYSRWNVTHEEYEAEKKRDKKATATAQSEMHRHCLTTHGHRHQFMGLIDSDEFLVVTDNSTSVADQLRQMMAWDPIGGLAVFWRMFGSAGHETRPPEGTLKGFTKCANATAKWSRSVKTLANTDYAIGPAGHLVQLNSKDAPPIVTEHFRVVTGNHPGNPSYDHIALHHYLTRSREEFAQKQKRKSGAGRSRKWEEFDELDAAAIYDCTEAAERYGPYP